MNKSIAITDETVLDKIYLIKGKKVMLDRDLAEMYGVETKYLKRQVKRNMQRFPMDFRFELSQEEFKYWRSQFVTSNSSDKMGLRYPPFGFTEQGVAMLSSVLNSDTAIEVNIQIIRIFTRMRELMLTQKDVLLRMDQLEKTMLQQNKKTHKHEEDIQFIFNALKQLLQSPPEPRPPIGYKTHSTK